MPDGLFEMVYNLETTRAGYQHYCQMRPDLTFRPLPGVEDSVIPFSVEINQVSIADYTLLPIYIELLSRRRRLLVLLNRCSRGSPHAYLHCDRRVL